MNPRWLMDQVTKALEQRDQRIAELHARIDELIERLEALLVRIKALEEKRGPGRPPKNDDPRGN